jgi:hypothetical protein
MNNNLIEGIDFYYDENGYFVFTEKYHLEKGYCCGNGCKHCPYDFINVPEPKRSELLLLKRNEKN